MMMRIKSLRFQRIKAEEVITPMKKGKSKPHKWSAIKSSPMFRRRRMIRLGACKKLWVLAISHSKIEA